MSGVDHADRAVVCWRKVMSKVRLFDKRRAFCNDKLKIPAGLCCCSGGTRSLCLALLGKQQVLQS